jgi:hypothetical protein
MTTTTTPVVMNEFGFVLKQPKKAAAKAAKAPKAPKAPKAAKAPKAPRVTKMTRAIDVFRANKSLPLKDVQAKIAAELGVAFERAYGYVRTIVNQKLAD